MEHYNFQGKGYSKCLPLNLAKKQEILANDPDLYDLRQDIALAQLRVEELVGQLKGKATARWESLEAAYDGLDSAIRSGDPANLTNALVVLRSLIKEGSQDNVLWDKIEKAKEHKARLLQKERRWLVESDQMITSERLMMISAELVHIIKSRVPDEGVRGAIANDIDLLLNRGNNEPANVSRNGGNSDEHHVEREIDIPGGAGGQLD